MNSIFIILAFCIIIIDVVLLVQNKSNPALLLLNFFFLYFNYSVCSGIYIIGNFKTTSFFDPNKYQNIYEIGLVLLFFFSLLRLIVFFKKIQFVEFKRKSSIVNYTLMYVILLYIAIFEIDRSVKQGYEVSMSALYEYSFLLFIFLFYFQPKGVVFKLLTYLILLIIVIQNFVYGGRVASLQIITIAALFDYSKYIKIKNILVPFIIINLLFSAIALYRESYIWNVEISQLIQLQLENLFVSDTAVFAFYSSLTHIYMLDFVDSDFLFSSFLSFIAMIFVGGEFSSALGLDLSLANVSVMAKDFHWNAGGGFFFSHVYVWFGPIISIPIVFICLRFFRKQFKNSTNFGQMMLLVIVCTLPRWYLYSPLVVFRSIFVLLPILYLLNQVVYIIVHKKTLKGI